ncbi:hypothetical protein K488DRAFT_42813, partial [Vararia minispora EC-137]
GPLHPELQLARCMSNRYKAEQFPRCVACTRRWAGDTCRFQGIRFFLKDTRGAIVGASFVENQKPDGPNMRFPTRWNKPLDRATIERVKRTVAKALLPALKAELAHLDKSGVICRPRDSDVRATCDTCMTSIFSASWLCRLCGREACADCYKTVRELTEPRPGAGDAEIAAQQARREAHAHANPFFLSCTRRSEHNAQDFSPTSRFHRPELAQVIKAMEALLAGEQKVGQCVRKAPSDAEERHGGGLLESPARVYSSVFANGAAVSTAQGVPLTGQLMSSGGETSPAEIPAGSGSGTPILPCRIRADFHAGELSDTQFADLLKKGKPVIVTGLESRFESFTPDWFKDRYGSTPCSIVNTQTEIAQKDTVHAFFASFGKHTGPGMKLKDWPPPGGFRNAVPELWDALQKEMPFGSFCRRDGVLNLASHFPANMLSPELGPRMYCATETFTGAGSHGSTRLHLDTADGVNIMLYAEPCADQTPGFAVWDLYRAEDTSKIRKFLRSRQDDDLTTGGVGAAGAHDPILAGAVYLDDEMREELAEEYGVRSHRVYQRAGDAVFIPAGVAHQVANRANCIKVAIDFVSPENIARCEQLMDEFREQNQSMAWREDSLQLQTMMWFAWLSCTKQEAERDVERG